MYVIVFNKLLTLFISTCSDSLLGFFWCFFFKFGFLLLWLKLSGGRLRTWWRWTALHFHTSYSMLPLFQLQHSMTDQQNQKHLFILISIINHKLTQKLESSSSSHAFSFSQFWALCVCVCVCVCLCCSWKYADWSPVLQISWWDHKQRLRQPVAYIFFCSVTLLSARCFHSFSPSYLVMKKMMQWSPTNVDRGWILLSLQFVLHYFDSKTPLRFNNYVRWDISFM